MIAVAPVALFSVLMHGCTISPTPNDTPYPSLVQTHRYLMTEFNGHPIENVLVFMRKLLGLMPGTTITLTVLRDGKEIDIASTLAKRGPS